MIPAPVYWSGRVLRVVCQQCRFGPKLAAIPEDEPTWQKHERTGRDPVTCQLCGRLI